MPVFSEWHFLVFCSLSQGNSFKNFVRIKLLFPEVESRTQGSRPRPRPRTQKKSEAKAKAKDSLSKDRHSRGQGQECSRPRPRTKDTSASALQKKKKVFTKIFQAISKKKKKKKKGLHKNFSSDLHKKTFSKKFFNRSTKFQQFKKYCCPRAEDRPIFKDLRPRGQGQGLDLRGQGQGLQNVSSRTSSRPRTSSRTPPLAISSYWLYFLQNLLSLSPRLSLRLLLFKGGESSSQFQWFTIAKIEL